MSVLITLPRGSFRIVVQMTIALLLYSSSLVLRIVGQGLGSVEVACKMVRRLYHSTLSLFSKPIVYQQHLERHAAEPASESWNYFRKSFLFFDAMNHYRIR